MSADAGRNVAFTWGGQPVLGVRTKGLQASGVAINVTSDEDDGWQTLLNIAGENAVTVNVGGVTKDNSFILDWFNGNRTKAATFVFPNGLTISGDFYLQDLNTDIPYNEAVTFEATLLSTGELTIAT